MRWISGGDMRGGDDGGSDGERACDAVAACLRERDSRSLSPSRGEMKSKRVSSGMDWDIEDAELAIVGAL